MDLGPKDCRVLYLQEQHSFFTIRDSVDLGYWIHARVILSLMDPMDNILSCLKQYNVYYYIVRLVQSCLGYSYSRTVATRNAHIPSTGQVVLLRLPVVGHAVTAPLLDAPPADMCERVLCIRPDDRALKNSEFKLSWITDIFREITVDDVNDITVE